MASTYQEAVANSTALLSLTGGQNGDLIVTLNSGVLYYLDTSKAVSPVGGLANLTGGFWCPVGLAGPRGQKGLQGTEGAVGPRGLLGPQGSTGAAGQSIKGDQGETGPAGAPGLQGTTGRTGIRGPQGGLGLAGESITGPSGATGTAGAQGPQGAPGPPGTPGANGNTGATGTTGPQGEKGQQGTQGLSGVRGLRGEQGLTGQQGQAGPLLGSIPNSIQSVGSEISNSGVTPMLPELTSVHSIQLNFSGRSLPSRVLITSDSHYRGNGTVEQEIGVLTAGNFVQFGISSFGTNPSGRLESFSCGSSFWLTVQPEDTIIEIRARRLNTQTVQHVQSVISYTDIGEIAQ